MLIICMIYWDVYDLLDTGSMLDCKDFFEQSTQFLMLPIGTKKKTTMKAYARHMEVTSCKLSGVLSQAVSVGLV